MPRISVIIPTYNDEDDIGRTLDSLRAQTFQDFEVIVVDDGDDGTADIVRESPYRVVERTTTGIASALNRGIDEAEGEYIARHDADDTSHPERFEKQTEFLDEHPDVGVLGTGAYIVEDGEIRARRRVLERVPREAFFEKNHLVHGSVMMRRDVLDDVDYYDERLDHIEDLDLWVRIAETSTIANIDEPLYDFTVHEESVYAERFEEVLLLHKFIKERESGIPKEVEQAVYDGDPSAILPHMENDIATLHRTMAIEHLRYGRLREARKVISNSITEGMSAIDLPLYILSLTSPATAKRVADMYRKILNWRIARQNKHLSPVSSPR
ncbi:hypothetical protein A4G99_06565 [Haladaptatus sp. R4]|uniref:glycosyltransferase family 2 protein n=1 Tax=Haladaptatus sp. R4 TaxID=1679489 RepID=UPI0007B4C790|nr:glycosyltransferase family A protein [Haladaptatus sp. R4]KZN24109.1 hypothetical protein A4G99_06565 [Haladaptatus sp. R4]